MFPWERISGYKHWLCYSNVQPHGQNTLCFDSQWVSGWKINDKSTVSSLEYSSHNSQRKCSNFKIFPRLKANFLCIILAVIKRYLSSKEKGLKGTRSSLVALKTAGIIRWEFLSIRCSNARISCINTMYRIKSVSKSMQQFSPKNFEMSHKFAPCKSLGFPIPCLWIQWFRIP